MEENEYTPAYRDLYELFFLVRMLVLYHEKRANFFSRLNQWVAFISLVFGGSAAVAFAFDVTKVPESALAIIAAGVAILNFYSLVVNPSQLEAKHQGMRRDYLSLETRMRPYIANYDVKQRTVDGFHADKAAIERDAPAQYEVVAMTAYNDLVETSKDYTHALRYRVYFWEKWIGQWVQYDRSRFMKRGEPLPSG